VYPFVDVVEAGCLISSSQFNRTPFMLLARANSRAGEGDNVARKKQSHLPVPSGRPVTVQR